MFPNIRVPQNGWFIMENPIKMDDLRVPLFSETLWWLFLCLHYVKRLMFFGTKPPSDPDRCWISSKWLGGGTRYNIYQMAVYLPPRKLTWNLKMMVSSRNLLFQGFIFRFHVSFPGCNLIIILFNSFIYHLEAERFPTSWLFHLVNYERRHNDTSPFCWCWVVLESQ